MKKLIILLFFIFLIPSILISDVPNIISYQGKLLSAIGVPLNSNVSIEFKLYTVETGGSSIWSEIHNPVTVSDGIFNVELGKFSTLNNTSFDTSYWLGINVNNDGEMSPRIKLKSSPYSLYSKKADTAVVSLSVIPDPIFIGTVKADSMIINGTGLIVSNNGNTGIGEISPDAKLVIKSDGDDTSTKTFIIKDKNNQVLLYIDSAGNMGIGTDSPTYKLEVNGAIKSLNTNNKVYSVFAP